MSPAELNKRERIVQELTTEAKSAEEFYRLMREEYERTCERVWTTGPDGPQAAQAILVAAKGVRLARKRYMRANRRLAGFTAS